MSNHIHLLIQAKNNDLPGVLRDFKKFTSQPIVDAIVNNEPESRKRWMLWLFKQPEDKATNKTNYQFWQSDNHAELCFSLPFAWQKLIYIHNNPLQENSWMIRENHPHPLLRGALPLTPLLRDTLPLIP